MVRTLIAVMLLSPAAWAQVSSGNAQKGENIFQRCAVCHTMAQSGGNGLGPNLFGVAGRKAASLPSFHYSDALRKSGITWTDDMLEKWVQGPQKVVPGTRMTFPGLTSKQDADDVIAFLKTKK